MIHLLKRHLGLTKQMLKNRLRKNRGKRRYIHPRLGVEGFFKALKEADIDYAVLRWFETLPHLEDGEDIDILVADRDIHRLEPFLTGTRSYGTPCDIYTESGLPGTSYRGIAYFPEHLARELLDTAVFQDNLVRVPDPKRHLFSMAYHAAYHKGYESGLPSETGKSVDPAEVDHDYSGVLRSCALKAGLELPGTSLEAVDLFLREHHWNPARDALEKLSARNEWVRDRFFSDLPEMAPHWAGFSVFILREEGLDQLDLVRSMLFDAGFEILQEQAIEGEARQRAGKTLRGGNWNRGPWPVSGGLPAWLFAVNDCFPLVPDEKSAEKHQGLVNSRLLDTKIRIRDAVNRHRPRHLRCNVVHSADNPHQGLEYFHTAVPGSRDLSALEQRLKETTAAVAPRFPVIRELPGHGRRARVDLVLRDGVQAVCKTYRPGRERFLAREILARELGKELPEISPLLEHGENYLLLPLYEDKLDRNRPLPFSILRRTRTVIRHFRKQGCELIDFKPKNILLDPREGMKIIDFEFLQPGPEKTSALKGAFCWYTIPGSFEGDIPAGRSSRRNNYYLNWFPATALPLSFALRDLPAAILFPVRLAGQTALCCYHLLKKTRALFRKGLIRLKRGIIALLGRIG